MVELGFASPLAVCGSSEQPAAAAPGTTGIPKAAVGLGIVDQSVKYAWNQDGYRDAVVGLIIVAAVLFARDRSCAHRLTGAGGTDEQEFSTRAQTV